MKIVPNKQPSFTNLPYRIAIIGEAPGRDEEVVGQPFVGHSGRLLTDLLGSAGIIRDACFIGNVCRVRPPANDISAFRSDGPEFADGLAALQSDLSVFNPNIVVLLGNTALSAATDDEDVSISTIRGSLFRSAKTGPFLNRKCIASYHPAAVLRQWNWAPILKLDLKRARSEGESPELVLPERHFDVPLDADQSSYLRFLIDRLKEVKQRRTPISVDIEGYVDALACVGIATSATDAFIVPFKTANGSFWQSVEDETELWIAMADVLCDPTIPKVLQNSLYDNFVLSWSYRCPIRGVVDDTMLKHWELFSELEKSLAFQASIYTKEPYYKSDGKANDLSTFWRYCCNDAAVTYEINTVLDSQFHPAATKHYRFNINLLNPILYMELRGIRYDYDKAQQRRGEIVAQLDAEQTILNGIAGRELNVGSPKQMQKFFYTDLGLPPVTNRTTGKATLNYEALLSLAKKTGHPALLSAIRIRSLSTRARMLEIRPDADGRIRCGYNVVGSETGRLTSYTSPTGSGYNLHTIPAYDRDLFLADPDCEIAQLDLEGADSWTVAAHCAALGDYTMLEDLQAGIRPAKIVAVAFKDDPKVFHADRPTIKQHCDAFPKTDPIYFGAKCCTHGSSYGMGKVLLSATIFVQSEGSVNISAADAQRLQDLFFRRYPGVLAWHDSVIRQLKTKGYIDSAAGHRRIFFGRRDDHATHKAAFANEPQEITTYFTNLALTRLWGDQRNRHRNGSLRTECLHTVHDALLCQFAKATTETSLTHLREWFDNTVVVAGIPIRIPFDGGYGKSWGELTNKI